jgi:hypothetical protein
MQALIIEQETTIKCHLAEAYLLRVTLGDIIKVPVFHWQDWPCLYETK